mmetsp:Transcript_54953/g.170546  ORF Transcript_54953/g.170546 Transcript_54953/m.170546 type:complete len:232 (+) Transcript_54953:83-778(+)
MSVILSKEALGPLEGDALGDSGMVPSPNPPSVCPTEMSLTSTAFGECANRFSDVFSEVDSDVSAQAGLPDALAEYSQLREVSNRLDQVFQRLAAEEVDESGDEDDLNSGTDALDAASGQFRALLGSQAACGTRSERKSHESPDPGRALLEHYGVLGAASGSWRRSAPPSSPESARSEEDDGAPWRQALQEVCDDREADPSDRPWRREWPSLGQGLARVLRSFRAKKEEDDA